MLRTAIRTLILSMTLSAGLLFSGPNANASDISVERRAELQLALRQHISENTSDGQYRYFDPDTGNIRLFRLKHLHSEMFRKEGFYLLCADFVDSENNEVILDYVLHQSDSGFRIDQVLKGRRSFLMNVFEKIL